MAKEREMQSGMAAILLEAHTAATPTIGCGRHPINLGLILMLQLAGISS